MLASMIAAVLIPLLPLREERLVREVAVEYGLTTEQTSLLRAIRRTENGSRGLEFGVKRKRAERFRHAGTWEDSFRCQARWAAGTIRKRYTGDLEEFSRHWLPRDREVWRRNVKWFMARDLEASRERKRR